MSKPFQKLLTATFALLMVSSALSMSTRSSKLQLPEATEETFGLNTTKQFAYVDEYFYFASSDTGVTLLSCKPNKPCDHVRSIALNGHYTYLAITKANSNYYLQVAAANPEDSPLAKNTAIIIFNSDFDRWTLFNIPRRSTQEEPTVLYYPNIFTKSIGYTQESTVSFTMIEGTGAGNKVNQIIFYLEDPIIV